MKTGKLNIGIGFLFLAGFMLYGFVLIYLRDFAQGKEEWILGSLTGPHFESKLAHAHGNLFAFLNIVIGYLLMNLSLTVTDAKWISRLALAGMLMPIGILSEVLFGLPPFLVIIGGISIVTSSAWFGIVMLKKHE
ncbi:MAG: hypothetical protein Q8L88_08155 [Bacteroidota bacterium]|nr:hypothetical protein [Bacteroidota bacterium]